MSSRRGTGKEWDKEEQRNRNDEQEEEEEEDYMSNKFLEQMQVQTNISCALTNC